MLLKLFYFFKGYVIIKITGSFPERFLNLAMQKNVYIWDVEKKEDNCLYIKISARGFLRLKSLAGKTGCRVSIVKKQGIFFFVSRYKKRTAFMTGFIIFLLSIVLFSSFVWKIEITGTERIDNNLLLSQLNKNGLKTPMLLKNVDANLISSKMKRDNKDISWIMINIKGIKAKVEVKETTRPPEIVDLNTATNIVSTKDGVIESLYLRKGFPVVKRGQTVKKGELLISGVTDTLGGVIRYENSDADILLRVWYQQQFTQPKNVINRTYTGKTKTRYILNIGKFKMNPLFFLKTYETCDEEEKTVLTFPFTLSKITYKEYTEDKITLSTEEALNTGKQEILENIKKMMTEGEIDHTTFDYQEGNNEIIINAEVQTLERATAEVIINK